MKKERKPQHLIESLARGMKVLQAFSAEQPNLTLQNLAVLTGFNKTAVQRLTDTLMTLGYLGRNQHKEFFLEPKILTLGFAYLNGSKIRQMALTHIEEFGRRMKRNTNLGVLDGHEAVFLYRYQTQTFFAFDLREGSRLPVNGSSMGKILLAALPTEELERRLKGLILKPLTRYSITDLKEFRQEIARTRARGYGINDREGSLALFSVAAPLIDHQGKTVAAVNVSLPVEGEKEDVRVRIVKELLSKCKQWSELLGYHGPYPWPGASLDLKALSSNKNRD